MAKVLFNYIFIQIKGQLDTKSNPLNADLLQQNQQQNTKQVNKSLIGSNTILGVEKSPSVTSTNSSEPTNNISNSKANNKQSNSQNYSDGSRKYKDKQSTLFVIAKGSNNNSSGSNQRSPSLIQPLQSEISNEKQDDLATSSSNFSNLDQDIVIDPSSKLGILVQTKLLEDKV